MTENFENDAHDYLLNQMEAARRTAFEQELQRNPAAAGALKRYADSLAGFACEIAGPETLSAPDHQAVLAALVKAARTPPAVRQISPPLRFEWRRLVWPAAAALLVLLNLIEFERPLAPAATSRTATAASERTRPGREQAKPAPSNAEGATAGDAVDAEAEATAPDAEPKRGEARILREAERELEHLRANVADLQREQARLRAEYDAVIRRHEEQRAADRGLNRLATMELVDAATYARGERRGLVAVGRGILSEPGVVTSPETGAGDPGVSTAAVVQQSPAYAWSVFDEKAHQGTINLYNLPEVTEGQAIQVWVRAADAVEFTRVAEVPANYHGGNGTVEYTLPEDAPAPAEMVVTVEASDTESTAPTGTVLLRGP